MLVVISGMLLLSDCMINHSVNESTALPKLLMFNCMITSQVCNHRSMADDPAMISSLLPFWMCLQLKNIRWGICTQNQLFTLKQSNVLHALAGALYHRTL